jgi:uncharacterized DUF497 family protein
VQVVDLEIADHILEKIQQKHGVTFEEVEDACFNRAAHFRLGTRENLTLLYSRTGGGHYLQVVLAPRGQGNWAVVTARDMDASERRRYREQKGLT